MTPFFRKLAIVVSLAACSIAPVLAQSPLPPLNLNFGTAPNDGTGDPLRTAFTKVQSAVNGLNGLIGAPSGIATLDTNGLLPGSELAAGAALTNLGNAPLLPSLAIGARQANINQLGQISSPYTTSMLNTQNDVFRVDTGGYPVTAEVGATGHAATSSIAGTLVVPAGSYSGPYSWPDSAISAHIINYNTSKYGVGFYSAAGVGVNGAPVEGGNFTAINCAIFASTCDGTHGFDVVSMTAFEADAAVYGKAGGVAPIGDVYGLEVNLNATMQNTGALTGLIFATANTQQWKTAIATGSGVAATGLSLGAQAATGPSNSQTINLTALNGSSAPLFTQIYEDSIGDLIFADNAAAATLAISSNYPQLAFSQNVATSGMKLSTTGTGGSEVLIMQTGSPNNYLQLALSDAGSANLALGSGVSGGFNLSAAAFKINNAAGADCAAGAPSSSFTVTHGVVTHC